jgi:membrane-associated phospholipid phosphatase
MGLKTEACGFWPVDALILCYFLGISLLILFYWSRIPGAAWLIALHISGGLLVVVAERAMTSRFRAVASFFRHWYPWLGLGVAYKEMGILIPAIRRSDADAALARLDFALWGVHPTVWLERVQTTALTESLQITYSLFIPALLLVAVVLWWQGRVGEFRYYVFLIALGFLVSFLGYFLVPARGPRFLLDRLQTKPLEGWWAFPVLREALDWLEGIHYDCFPSGHTALTVLAWWSSRSLSRGFFWTYSAYTICMVFSTVYLRYHYAIDTVAGAVVAVALLVARPYLYGPWQSHGEG